jgi:hypothetical protein
MFNVHESILTYNQHNSHQIDSAETWGLWYLQAANVAFLNKSDDIVLEAAKYDPPYYLDRTAVREELAKAETEPNAISMAGLQSIVRKIKNEKQMVRAYEWELRTKAILDDQQTWQRFEETAQQTQQHEQLLQLKQDWQQHKIFYLHSTPGLVFLLYQIIQYQQLFADALKELADNQKRFWRSKRMPAELARQYQTSLLQRSEDLEQWRAQVLDAMLLRLRVASEQADTTTDHVSSYLVKKLQELGCMETSYFCLQTEQRLDTVFFNQLHNALEQQGSKEHKKKLNRLLHWHNTNQADVVAVKTKHRQLLAPIQLAQFVPYTIKSPRWLFSDSACVEFFEEHRQLFANLTFSWPMAKCCFTDLPLAEAQIKKSLAHYQLAVAAKKTALEEKIPWWQLNRKKLHAAWCPQITSYVHNLRDNLIAWVIGLDEMTQTNADLFANETVRANLWAHVEQLKQLLSEEIDPVQQQRLAQAMQRLSCFFKQDTLSQWKKALDDLYLHRVNMPITEKQDKVEWIVNIKQQLQISNTPSQQAALQVRLRMEPTCRAVAKIILPSIKHHLRFNSNLEVTFLDIKVMYALGNAEEKKELHTYLDYWLIRQARSIAGSVIGVKAQETLDAVMTLAKQIYLMCSQYGSARSQAHFQAWTVERIQQQWQEFVQAYIAISDELAADYAQSYADKVCTQVEEACQQKLRVLANCNEDKLRIFNQVSKQLIDDDKQSITKQDLIGRQAIVASNPSVVRVINLQANLSLFKRQIQQAATVSKKTQVLNALIDAASRELPECVSLFGKKTVATDASLKSPKLENDYVSRRV